jgi:hypothetical protein
MVVVVLPDNSSSAIVNKTAVTELVTLFSAWFLVKVLLSYIKAF